MRHELALQVRGAAASAARSVVTKRARLLLAVASVVTMMGGTVVATTTVEHALVAADVAHLTDGPLLRVGQFESTDGHAVGQIVAYRADPSLVLLSIRDPGMNGPVDCRIQMSNGRTAATGIFVVHNGAAELARTIAVDVGQFRVASLVTSAGSVLATASFPAS